MAIELITGRYGAAHIGSEDVRAYQAYTAGSGRYVLHGGGASIQSANDIHVNPAEILIDGAHVRITGTGEDVTIDNGASSYKRVDIIALHYKMTGDGDTAVESITLDVVKGTPAEGTPQDPSMPATGSILDNVSETYVPYVRVMIDGLTPQTPTVLLPDYVNPSDLSGDGDQVNPSVLVNLGSGDADTIYKASPRPGVYGTLPASKGGTGQTSLQAARNAMGLGNTSGALPVANGGTGVTRLFGNPGLLHDLHPSNIFGNALAEVYLSAFTTSWGSGGYVSATDLLSVIYPVGTVYISYNSTSPASLFGGSWTPITGRFPYFNAGTGTGGSNSVTLSVGNMPAHSHHYLQYYWRAQGTAVSWNQTQWEVLHTDNTSDKINSATSEYSTASTGGNAAFSNMPAYQTLYAWRRTA